MTAFNASKLARLIQKLEELLLAYAIIIIAALTIANVISRSVFNVSLAFTEEISQFLIIFVTFLGLGYGAARGRHIRMTALYDQCGDRVRKVLMIIIAATTSLLMFALAFYAMRYVTTMYALHTYSPVLQVPFYLIYLAAPLGLLLSGIQYALTVARNLSDREVYLSYHKKDEYEEVLREDNR